MLETLALIRIGMGPCLALRFAALELLWWWARVGFNHVEHRLWGAGADEGCGTQGRWAALLGCRAGSRRREASIIKERDETKVRLRCHLK